MQRWPYQAKRNCTIKTLNYIKIYIKIYMTIYIKIYITTVPDMFRCYIHTIIRERINLCLLKLHLLK